MKNCEVDTCVNLLTHVDGKSIHHTYL
jgi:hypothetical protein